MGELLLVAPPPAAAVVLAVVVAGAVVPTLCMESVLWARLRGVARSTSL